MIQEQKYFFKFTDASYDGETVWYSFQVTIKGDNEPTIIKARYSQLRDIHQKCQATQFKNDLPDFPKKKLFGNTSEDFIQKRKKQLENYYTALSKIVDIQKLPDLHSYIEKRRKKPVVGGTSNDQKKKIVIKDDQETLLGKLKASFDEIYKDVLGQISDLSKDFYPTQSEVHDDSSKRFTSQIRQIKPKESQLLSEIKVEGVQENDTDFWGSSEKEDHQDLLSKSKSLLSQLNSFEKQLNAPQKESIVIVK